MLLHSDRIILNSKGEDGDIYLSSKRDVHIGTGRHLTISANEDFIIESQRTFLGGTRTEQMESMILGDSLILILEELLNSEEPTSEMQQFSSSKSGKKVINAGNKIKSAGKSIHELALDQTGRMRETLGNISEFVYKVGNALSEINNFLKVCKTCNMKKINSSFLLYIVSKECKSNMYTKSNYILLRDTLPRRKRLQLEFLMRKK